MKHSKAFNEALKRVIFYLQTPKGKKEFREHRENSIALQDILSLARMEAVEGVLEQLKHESEVRADIRSVIIYIMRIIRERHLSNIYPKG